MDYFKALNLEQEPFSNSPDPGLFFSSKQHLEALQKLEIAIRLKRGLSVITGSVGTGKTTLSRQLIQKLSHDPDIASFLILDPGFSSSNDFLHCILSHFTGRSPDRLPETQADDAALKEEIKKYLFSRGVDQDITTVLMIDEGQKLPVFCLEILRELLNYETNEHKLLQIVIFAQEEFNDLLQALENFNDRINFRYDLQPLGFFETRDLIRFRLEKSSAAPAAPLFFTFFAYVAIYRLTRGFPRKIINLCHHVMIGLIIKNRTRADYSFVTACAKAVFFSQRSWKPVWVTVMLVFIIFMSGMAFFNADQEEIPVMPAEVVSLPVVNKDIPGALWEIARVSADEPVQPVEPAAPVADVEQPKLYGTVRIPKNETLSGMVRVVYGSYRPEYVNAIIESNPKIKHPDRVQADIRIDFPVNPLELDGIWKDDPYIICLATEAEFDKAVVAARNLRRTVPGVRIISGWDNRKGFLFSVVVNRTFDTISAADAYRTAKTGMEQGNIQKLSSCNEGREIL